MKVIVAENLGFCFGVKRAYNLAIKNSKNSAIMGMLVHNDEVQNNLYNFGIKQYTDDIETSNLILRSHGTVLEERNKLEKNYNLIDTTCPVLINIYKKMKEKENDDYITYIIGDPNHPEVIATKSYLKKCEIIYNEEDVNKIDLSKNIYITTQTTLNENKFKTISKLINDFLNINNYKKNIIIENTICNASELRRQSLYDLMMKCEYIILLGDQKSNNTKELEKILIKNNFKYSFVNNIFSIDFSEIKRYNIIGISAGASTPEWIIKEAVTVLNDLEKQNVVNEKESINVSDAQVEMNQNIPNSIHNGNPMSNSLNAEVSTETKANNTNNSSKLSETETVNDSNNKKATFGADTVVPDEKDQNEMMQIIEDTFTRIRRGQIINGTVLYVTESQIMVNINYRADGIIDRDELPENITDPRQHYKAGDNIEVYIVKIDDGEGNVVLSLRRIKDVNSWNELEEKFNSKEILKVNVLEETKGGLIVEYNGAKAFMPASHAYDHFRKDLSGLVGQTVDAELIDFDKSKRRAIFSRRELERNRIKKEKDEFWNNIHEGDLRKGTVQRLTNFGAFVDIGGMDALIHVSDISWDRIRDPKERLKVGDEVEAIVLKLDRENEKVSLGIKQKTVEPWKLFVENNKVGDIVTGTVVNMPDFGAFVRLKEGVDGLIHVSQICREHIEKPSDVLNIGQEVEAKIVDIKDDRKISLSMKALLEPVVEEKRPRRERAPKKEIEKEEIEIEDTTPIDNPLIDNDILSELKKMAQESSEN